MFQACQNLPLAPKSLNYRCEIMPAADCLQCNFFCELSIRPHCTVDLSHAAAADLLNNSVHADLLPRIYAGARTPCSSSQDVDYGSSRMFCPVGWCAASKDSTSCRRS